MQLLQCTKYNKDHTVNGYWYTDYKSHTNKPYLCPLCRPVQPLTNDKKKKKQKVVDKTIEYFNTHAKCHNCFKIISIEQAYILHDKQTCRFCYYLHADKIPKT